MVWCLHWSSDGKVVLYCISSDGLMAVYPGHEICLVVNFGVDFTKSRCKSFCADNIQKFPEQLLHSYILWLFFFKGLNNSIVVTEDVD